MLMKLFNLFKKKEKPASAKAVYRVDVLRYAKKHKWAGLCKSITEALLHYDIPIRYHTVSGFFPMFTRDNAIKFGAATYTMYWWDYNVWDTGREDFLDWLIKYYKNDKTNLREFL